jgi:hypothetical protein
MPTPSHVDEQSFDQQLIVERQHIVSGRTKRLGLPQEDVPWCGIGLSGGGIRSACLALGVLQLLAERNLLSRFDYISTVSGGGYMGSSLQWWWARIQREDKKVNPVVYGTAPADFPYGPNLLPNGPLPPGTALAGAIKNLDFLRAHASYLTPGNELTVWSMLVVVLRTVTISLLIWLPLLVALFIAWHLFDARYLNGLAKSYGLGSPIGTIIPLYWDQGTMRDCQAAFNCQFNLRAGYAIFIYLFEIALGWFGFVAILYGFLSRTPQDRRTPTFLALSIAGAAAAIVLTVVILASDTDALDTSAEVFILVLTLLFAFVLIWALTEVLTPRSLNPSYWLRRTIEKWLGRLFIPSLVFLAIGLVPVASYYIGKSAPDVDKLAGPAGSVAGVLSLLSGIASALYSYYVFVRNIIPGWATKIAITAGAIIYLYGTAVLAYWLSIAIVANPLIIYPSKDLVHVVAACLVTLALLLAIYGNINFVGLHRYYRDRLMEAFMPNDASVTMMRTRRSPVADGLSVAALESSSCADPADATFVPKPYPLINTNVILVKDDNPKFATRGGANFLISPLFIGSSATGWVDTASYIARNGPMTLPTAMAASGAAASASAGYIGTGITMNPVVAAVMSLLNIRLGLWVGNPSFASNRKVRRIPTFFNPGLWAGVLGRGHRRTNRFLELTDGGHFENLAMYELVRRKLSVIVVVDGEADPQISLASLVSARNRIEQDFGARLEFFDDQGPELLVMHSGRGYPVGAKVARSPFIVGRIIYNDGTIAAFIYIKSNVTPKLDFSIAGYLASNQDFPHQSTADQFFSPDQFDAYRNLGAAGARKVIDTLDLASTIGDPQAIFNTYKNHGPREQDDAPVPVLAQSATAKPNA